MGSALEEKSSFRMLGPSVCSELEWGFYIVSIAKTVTKSFGPLIYSVKFLSLKVAL